MSFSAVEPGKKKNKKFKTESLVVTLPTVGSVDQEIQLDAMKWKSDSFFSSTNINVNLTDEEKKFLRLPATYFVYRTDYIFALHVCTFF